MFCLLCDGEIEEKNFRYLKTYKVWRLICPHCKSRWEAPTEEQIRRQVQDKLDGRRKRAED